MELRFKPMSDATAQQPSGLWRRKPVRFSSTQSVTTNLTRGDGLRLDEELWHGQSYQSDTFQNAPLHGDVNDPEFECSLVEVFGFL